MGRRASPVRDHRSPRRNSPSQRKRSPARDKNSNAEQLSSRNRSSRHSRSRSPAVHSQTRRRSSNHTKSPIRRKSPSPVSRSPHRHRSSGRTRSPPPVSPTKGKPPPRTRSPKRGKPRSSESESVKEQMLSIRTSSPRSARSRSPESRSPSPRTKRLKKAKTDRDAEKGSDKEHVKNSGRKDDRAMYKEKDSDKEVQIEKRDRTAREAVDNSSSRSSYRHSVSPSNNHHRTQRRSRSPSAAESRGRDEWRSSRDDEQGSGDNDSIAQMKAAEETLEAKEKQKPSFELSGKLAAETNRFRGVTLLFNEPPDARKPDVRWRLYVLKGGEVLNEPLYVHRQSSYLFGRERRVADIPTDHPSCSKQHAVLQFRQVEQENPDGTMSKRIRPYLMDLGSTNGTFVNESQIEAQRYYELLEKDTIKFGNSSREYVLLHENSA